MNNLDLDKLLKQHFSSPPTNRLNQLEQDVWRRIRLEEAKPTLASRLQEWFAPLWTPQFRFAPVAMAVMIGLFAGSLTPKDAPYEVSSVDMLSLSVFSAEYSRLPSALMKVKL